MIAQQAATELQLPAEAPAKPKLLYVYGRQCGRSRRVEALIAQVLQRRRNHETFQLVRVCAEDHRDLAEHLRVTVLPTILVVEQRTLRARLERPKGRHEIEALLAPWLR